MKKRLTGEELLVKVDQLRSKRTDLILSATGYLKNIKDLRQKGQFSFKDYQDFLSEFFWAYVGKHGLPERLEGEEYYKNSPSMIYPDELILPPDLMKWRDFRRFEHALRTGHIAYGRSGGSIRIEPHNKGILDYGLPSQTGKAKLSDNQNRRLEREELLDLIESLPSDTPTSQIAYKAGYKSLKEYRLYLAKAKGISNAHERELEAPESPKPSYQLNQASSIDHGFSQPGNKENKSPRLSRIKNTETTSESNSSNNQSATFNRKTGREIVEYAIAEYEAGIAETSICIKSGYKTDSIGQFRRVFAKAANVDLAPLSRMIAEYRKQFDPPEVLSTERAFAFSSTKIRLRDGAFRESVIALHGSECKVCGMHIPELIEAAHIVPVALDGVDHPSNGIPLCPTHHSAFDRYLFAFDPIDQSVVFKDGLNASMLGITKSKLTANVSSDALKMRYDLFEENNS